MLFDVNPKKHESHTLGQLRTIRAVPCRHETEKHEILHKSKLERFGRE